MSVDFFTTDGSASSAGAADFTSTSGTLNWAAGDATPQTIVIPITDDATAEGNETFTITLTNATGGAGLGGTVTVTVTITNDDVCGTIDNGDLNRDSVVNIVDLNLVLSHFGQQDGDAGWDPMADANCDGVVNIVDLNEVLSNFGTQY